MANFIKQTRLVKTDNGTRDNPDPLPVPETVATLPGIAAALSDFSALLKTPIPKEQEGAYRIEYDLSVYYQIHVIGAAETEGHLVCDVDFWYTKADSAKPPVVRNTFITQIRDYAKVDTEALLAQIIEEYLIHVSLNDRTGDERDLVLATTMEKEELSTDDHVVNLYEKEVELS